MLLTEGGFCELPDGGGEAALLSVRAHIDILIANGLSVGGGGKFDPADVTNATVTEGLAGRSDFWCAAQVAAGQRRVRALVGYGGQDTPVMRNLPPRRFDVVFRRTFGLDGTKVAGTRRLRMPLPLEDRHLTDLRIRPEGGVAGALSIQPGRLELKVDAKGAERVTLGAALSFTAWPQAPHGPEALSDAKREKWLRDREGGLLLTDKVRGLARRLAQPGEAQTVWAFRDHIIDNFCFGVVPFGEFNDHPLDWMLETGWFDCRLGALMLVALCRAYGVPARLVGGFLIWNVPTEHYWMEAWLPGQGWTAFDLLSWGLSAGGDDPAWRTVYDDALDYRMKTQVLPDLFTGSPGIAFPTAWRRLYRAIPGGSETWVISALDGALIYSDEIRIAPAVETETTS